MTAEVILNTEKDLPDRRGAVVLCGGRSTRMGQDKASLPFGTETMLARVIRIVADVVPERMIVVVAAEGQELPPLNRPVRVVYDREPEQGPLEGLAVGLQELDGKADFIYATSCDVPLLVPAFVEHMFQRISSGSTETGISVDPFEIAVPRDGSHFHPLAAVYHSSVLKHVQQLLSNGQRRPRMLFQAATTLEVDVEELRTADPELRSLMNLNHPDDYQRAIRLAGL